MPKTTIPLNFAQGLDTKTDPKQVPLGKFRSLKNSVFTKTGMLKKRNGYEQLSSLPSSASYVTTFNEALTAIGSSLEVYSQDANQWVSKGHFQSLDLSVTPVIKNNFNQNQCDSAVSSSGLTCVVYTENNGSTNSFKYVVIDSQSGQNIISPQTLAGDTTYGTPRVFVLGSYFIVAYVIFQTATFKLAYLAIPIQNPGSPNAQVIITSSIAPAATVAWDALPVGNQLYFLWNGASSSGMKMAYLTTTLALSPTVVVDASHQATMVSLCLDAGVNILWASYYNLAGTVGYTVALDLFLTVQTHFPAQIISSGTILNLASAAQSGVAHIFYETSHTDTSIQTNFISSVSVTQSSGAVSAATVTVRSLGLASKAFISGGSIYFLAAFSSPFQPTYFLINGSLSTSTNPVIVGKLAYENGGGYLATGLPSVTLIGTKAYVPYLFKDLIQAISDANSQGTVTVGGIYSQTGVNLAAYEFTPNQVVTAEIGSNLNLSGGFLWAYDGYSLVENGFHLWPEQVQNTATATTGGHLQALIYFYLVLYEWSDNQGNLFRSAPSIPIKVDLSGSGTATNTATLVVPTLRVTAKTANPVKITIYRFSTNQQNFRQITSITSPTLNDPTVDSVTFVDTLADSSIVGNNIVYTTGGVVENIGGPSFKSVFLFDDRLWGITSEDPNLLWYSKQVIESTPVEMSDLLTYFVAPNIGSEGPSGSLNCGFPMDDKAILFKNSSILYFNGAGPDNTGANSSYSQPTFITSTVGCQNPLSIVLTPEGLMFEFRSPSGNQIWLLGRGLGTTYIGAPVEELTKNSDVLSAVNIPGKNQVLFTLDNGTQLMYDYYFNEWSEFVGIPALSATLYQGLHTFINSFGQVFQESPGFYQDGSNPVLMSFTTAWVETATLQGFQRFYSFYFLGTYHSPHLLNVKLAYDYNDSYFQSDLIQPINFSSPTPSAFGDQSAPFGSQVSLEQWNISAMEQKCQSFSITMEEVFDASMGVSPGEGFSLSGLSLIVMLKKTAVPLRSLVSTGG